ncbi:superoxide dismutase [Solwaraspora sp. WMMA2065]|uniref:superoxide dismutase n=1 Tax=Solwaraspora sp. WMMA2065 TaxID=3015166 RepID=UPI00259BA5DD|nr:superoxide dismutase [Solwaraspora sp. WMMA2065]WJK36163.1 superoxide dismutase [Solwaraspora sp. WMMA2065]
MSGDDSRVSTESAFVAAQRAAGFIAARQRGDHDGAAVLLAEFPDEAARTRGFCVLAELALALVRAQTGQSMDDLVQELSLQMAAMLADPPSEPPAAA